MAFRQAQPLFTEEPCFLLLQIGCCYAPAQCSEKAASVAAMMSSCRSSQNGRCVLCHVQFCTSRAEQIIFM